MIPVIAEKNKQGSIVCTHMVTEIHAESPLSGKISTNTVCGMPILGESIEYVVDLAEFKDCDNWCTECLRDFQKRVQRR